MAQANIEIILGNGQKAGQTINELRQQANRLTKEINNLKPGTEQFVKKSADLKKVTGRLGEVRKEVKGTTEAANGLTQSFTQFLPFSGQLGSMLGGVRGLTGGFKGLRLAIIATGLGALVLVVTGLVTWFKRTEKGAQALRVIMAGMGQVTDSLMDVLTNLGEAIHGAFTNPKKAITDFGNMLKDFVLGRFELMMSGIGKLGDAFNLLFEGEFKAAMKSAGDGLVEFTRATNPAAMAIELLIDGTKAAVENTKDLFAELQSDAKAAMQLAREENDLKVKNRAFLIEEAKYRAEIAQLRVFATDVTRTDEERQEALAKAIVKLNEVEAKKIALKGEELRILKAQQEISITDEAGKERAAQLEAELIRLQESKASSMRRIIAQESALRETMNLEREAALKKMQTQEIKVRENLQNLNIELMEDGLQKEIEKMWLDTERKIEALVGTEEQITEQRILLEDLRLQKLQELRAKHAEKQLSDAEKTAEAEKKIAEDKAKFQKDMADAEAEIASDVTGFLSDELSSRAKDEEAAKQIQKASQLTEIGINLQGELSANALAAAANPLNAVTFGAAGAAQLTRSNLASLLRAGLSTAKVLAFEQGGLLQGPRHLHGGIRAMIMSTGQPIEMEGGEYVFSRKAVQGIGAGVLDSINRRYETGGPVNPFSAPTSTKTASDFVSSSSASDEALIREFRAFKEEITQWQRELIVNNNLQEVDRGLKTLNKLENNASV